MQEKPEQNSILITFLGTGNYQSAGYQLDGKHFTSQYVAQAIASILRVDEVHVLATKEARQCHGKGITQAVKSSGAEVFLHEIPGGSCREQQWELFEAMRAQLVQFANAEVVVDITHGFRAQPFFASTVISLLRATEHGCADLRLLYGEFQPGQDAAPIWDLTLFVELQDWVHALVVFLRSGRADILNTLASRAESAIRRNHYQQGGGHQDMPKLKPLVNAISRFADDLATVRIASILLGIEENATKPGTSTAQALLQALQQCSGDVSRLMPPLQTVLEDLRNMVAPMCGVTTLSGATGHAALVALAELYSRLGRYAEAVVVVREGYICLSAGKGACDVGRDFADDERQGAEHDWYQVNPALQKQVGDIRNDIEHGGFRKQPLAGSALKKRVIDLVDRFAQAQAVASSEHRKPTGKTFFVSRHAGAVLWAKNHGIVVDQHVIHLQPEEVGTGDTVIGSLPVHLVAAICQRGAQYINLSMDLPRDLRGRELTAEEMERCAARLESFEVLNREVSPDIWTG